MEGGHIVRISVSVKIYQASCVWNFNRKKERKRRLRGEKFSILELTLFSISRDLLCVNFTPKKNQWLKKNCIVLAVSEKKLFLCCDRVKRPKCPSLELKVRAREISHHLQLREVEILSAKTDSLKDHLNLCISIPFPLQRSLVLC